MQWTIAKIISLLISVLLLQACQWSSSGTGYTTNTQMPPSSTTYRAAKIQACDAGELSYEARQNALNIFNDIRAQHGLQPVSYDAASDEWVMQAALVMAANERLEHEININWRCYSEAAEKGASHSNIGLYRTSNTSQQAIELYEKDAVAENLIGYMTEINHVEPGNVGHRRWALNPFLGQMAYGQVSDIVKNQFVSSSAVRVIYDESQQRSNAYVATPGNIIAYPYGDYPAKYFARGAELSFSVMIDANDYYANYFVDYQKATIAVRQGFNHWNIPQRDIKYDAITPENVTIVGLPNHLQFSFSHIDYNQMYEVEINNVEICLSSEWMEQGNYFVLKCSDWISQNYHYSFKIIP